MLVWLGLALVGCASSGAPSSAPLAVGARQRGLATYYSSSLAGQPTASGEAYNPQALTAAHRVLPLGALVRVRRLDDRNRPIGRGVVVRINDRGPYGRGLEHAVIDLSWAAAQRLSMVRVGHAQVELELLARPERQPYRAAGTNL